MSRCQVAGAAGREGEFGHGFSCFSLEKVRFSVEAFEFQELIGYGRLLYLSIYSLPIATRGERLLTTDNRRRSIQHQGHTALES